jgi:hypothetical protein
MKTIVKTLAFLLLANTCQAAEKIPSLVGYWESHRGAIYESDGTDFVCKYIPEQHMKNYWHWRGKNRLTEIKITASGMEASQYLRWKDGRVQTTPTKIEIRDGSIYLEYQLPNKDEPVITKLDRVDPRALQKSRTSGGPTKIKRN